MGKVTVCPNQKGSPRIPFEICEARVREKRSVCRKRDRKRCLRCSVAKEILEKKEGV